MTWLYYVVAVLDGDTTSRVEHVITEPTADAYTTLKMRLVGIYGLTDREKAARVLDASTLGDRSPLVFVNELLQLVAGEDVSFLVREIFLRALPHDVATMLTSSNADLRDLAAEADKHFASTGARLNEPSSFATNTVESNPTSENIAINATMHPPNERPPRLCYFHKKFGSAALRCRTPCIYTQ